MGEFSIEQEMPCPECLGSQMDEDCEFCKGEGIYKVEFVIPWDTCKKIFKEMVLASPNYEMMK
jgi:DnaJ-class molecular chaperone